MIPYCAVMSKSENNDTTSPEHDLEGSSKHKQRAKGRGTLVKRGNTYYGRWVVAGKVHTASLKTSLYKEAEQALREKMKLYVARDEEASLANAVARLSKARETVAELEAQEVVLPLKSAFSAFKSKMATTSPETMAMYESQFGRFENWIAANEPTMKEMREVTPQIAQRFMDDVAVRFSSNTHNKYLSLMRLIWRKLSKRIQAKCDPWADIERRANGKSSGRRALTVAELSKVCALLDGEMKILFALGIYTGLRLADCALLKWESVDLKNRLLHVLPHKTARTGKLVTVSIHPTLERMLIEAANGSDSPYVMPHTADDYEHRNEQVVDRIQAVFEKAGIRTKAEVKGYSRKVTVVGFHSLRHTFVSLCGNGGMPLAYVQSIVGHSSPMMTSHYFHADAEAHREQLNAALPDLIDIDNAHTRTRTRTREEYRSAVAAVDKLTTQEKKRLMKHLSSQIDGAQE